MFLTLLLSSFLTFVELNCENLFDTHHDAGKEDTEFLSDGTRHWTSPKYWGKLNRIGQEILSCSEELPDLVALIEVENDSVLRDLTHRSLLRNAGYQYLMTESPDQRGVDVALLYQPARFRLLCYDYLEVPPLPDMRPTRDILYVQGCCPSGDTLHVFVLHSPSRYGGERSSRPNRLQVIRQLRQKLAELGSSSRVIITGDFNDYCDSPALLELYASGLQNVTCEASGNHGEARGTYRYRGEWHSLDHFLVSPIIYNKVDCVFINDAPFLLEDDPQYGGKRPFRTFQNNHYQPGFSDHLPLVVRFKWD
jgi:endonuclease/exonuclease/phosphatase family metal-dependent hydrolase